MFNKLIHKLLNCEGFHEQHGWLASMNNTQKVNFRLRLSFKNLMFVKITKLLMKLKNVVILINC